MKTIEPPTFPCNYTSVAAVAARSTQIICPDYMPSLLPPPEQVSSNRERTAAKRWSKEMAVPTGPT